MGINDADYAIHPRVKGQQRSMCPSYIAWSGMLARCYSQKHQAANPTYIGCSVVPEWRSFMTFRAWMQSQPWQGNELDKDLLIPGNKLYGPDTCVFVSSQLNTFIIDRGNDRGDNMLGVYWSKQHQKFKTQCSNPFTGDRGYLGLFICEKQAHEAWRAKKHEHALKLAEQQTDPRIAQALRVRYLEGATNAV